MSRISTMIFGASLAFAGLMLAAVPASAEGATLPCGSGDGACAATADLVTVKGLARGAAARAATARVILSERQDRKGTSAFKTYGSNWFNQTIYVKWFSQTRRGWQWPNATQAWVLPANRSTYYMGISCQTGEKLCYGAQSQDGRWYWGVGIRGDRSCASCCYICKNGSVSIRYQ